jgi:tripartite-type tricarboxylate transporter receptor subunit TctC
MRLKKYLEVAVRIALSIAVLAWVFTPPLAGAAVSFEGKQIRFMIGYPPGGGHDLEARIIARHLGKYLPGKPSIIVQNMPGAGGMIMGAYVYHRGKPNGTIMGLFGSSHALQPLLLKPDDVKYDLKKMSVVWSIAGVNIEIVRDFLNAKTAKDFLKVDPDKIVVAGRSKVGSSCIRGQLALQLLKIKGYRKVCGYGGTSPIKAAMERGEASYFTASAAHLIGGGAFVDLHNRGLVNPVWQAGMLKSDGTIVRAPSVKGDVPTLQEFLTSINGKPPSGPMWEARKAVSLGISAINRTLVTPPGTPSEIVSTLRKGIKQVAKDPKFIARWEQIFGQPLAPLLVAPEDGEKAKNDVLKPAPWQDFLKEFVWGKS